jgi:hypothetical protein
MTLSSTTSDTATAITTAPIEIKESPGVIFKTLTVKGRAMSLAVYKQLQRGTTEDFFDFEHSALRVRPLGDAVPQLFIAV